MMQLPTVVSCPSSGADENAEQIQDTEVDQPQGAEHVEDPQVGEVPYH